MDEMLLAFLYIYSIIIIMFVFALILTIIFAIGISIEKMLKGENMLIDTEKTLHLLNGLGKNPDEIAQTLNVQGIKGDKLGSNSCPLHVFLSKELGHNRFSVGGTFIMYSIDSLLPLPEPCRQFIKNFDQNKYPNLIEAQSPILSELS